MNFKITPVKSDEPARRRYAELSIGTAFHYGSGLYIKTDMDRAVNVATGCVWGPCSETLVILVDAEITWRPL